MKLRVARPTHPPANDHEPARHRFAPRASSASPTGATEGPIAPAVAASLRAAATAGGRALRPSERAPLAAAPSSVLDQVRVHDDVAADRLARTLDARAFTAGRDVFFRRGELQPESAEGRRILAHEIVHVAQQTGRGRGDEGGSHGRSSLAARLELGGPATAQEAEADRLASLLLAGAPAPPAAALCPAPSSANAGVVQRVKSLVREPDRKKKVDDLLKQALKSPRSRAGKRKAQKAVDKVVKDLVAQKVIDLDLLELRYRASRGGALKYAPPTGIPRGGIDAGRGFIFSGAHPTDPDTHAEAYPPGIKAGKAKPAEVEVFEGALDKGPEYLYSKLFHESQHVGQYQDKAPKVGELIFGQKGTQSLGAAQEAEAYGAEVLNAQYSGVHKDPAHLDEVYNRFQDHFAETRKPKLSRHLSSDQTSRIATLQAQVEAEYKRLRGIP